MFKVRKAQSTLEYIIILSAIVAAVIAGAAIFGRKDKTVGLGKLMNQAGENIRGASGKIADIAD